MSEKNKLENTCLSFLIGEEYFAVPVAKVLNVLERQPISQVPNSPKYLKGVINFRGEIISVIRTHRKFGMPEPPEKDKFVIITLELNRDDDILVLGAIADKVKDVIHIPPNEIKAVPKVDTDFQTNYLKGIYQRDEQFIMLLDVDAIFSKDEIGVVRDINEIKTQEIDE